MPRRCATILRRLRLSWLPPTGAGPVRFRLSARLNIHHMSDVMQLVLYTSHMDSITRQYVAIDLLRPLFCSPRDPSARRIRCWLSSLRLLVAFEETFHSMKLWFSVP